MHLSCLFLGQCQFCFLFVPVMVFIVRYSYLHYGSHKAVNICLIVVDWKMQGLYITCHGVTMANIDVNILSLITLMLHIFKKHTLKMKMKP